MTTALVSSPKAIYIGACTDIDPVIALPHIKHFVMVDSMPLSFCGIFTTYHISLGNLKWIDDLIDLFASAGFKNKKLSRSIDYQMFRFYNETTQQTVHYYLMTIFPGMTYPALHNDLQGADTLVSIGHHPHRKVLEYLTPQFDLVVKKDTYYGIEEDGDEPMWLVVNDVSSRIRDIYDVTNRKQQKVKNINLSYLDLYMRKTYSNPH